MPEAGAEPDRQQVSVELPFGVYPASPQGIIEIFSEPSGQGNVPASPELGDASGDIRVVEVLKEPEPEHLA